MSVFNALYADQYDTLYTDKDYEGECNLVEAAFSRLGRKPGSLLDVGCGTGTHVMEFARRGYACTGVDLSPAMIEIAEKKSAASNVEPSPKWIVGDARQFSAEGQFDSATMMFAVISYLTTNEDVVAGLSNVRRHLKPGAIFVCDFWYGPAVLSVRPNERVRVLSSPKGQTIRAASTTVNTFEHTADVTFRLWSIEGDHYCGETTETHRMRYFFPQEISLLLEKAGFACRHLSSFPTLDTPLTDDSWNALCIAEAV